MAKRPTARAARVGELNRGAAVEELFQEAAQCVGQALFETGSTKNETQIDSAEVPEDDVFNENMPAEMSPANNPGETQTDISVMPAGSSVGI